MAAFARGKVTLQNSFSVMGNSKNSFGKPYHVQRSSLFSSKLSRPITTTLNPPFLVSHGTHIIPLLHPVNNSELAFSTENAPRQNVLFPQEVDLSKFKFSDIRKNSKGGNFLSVFYESDGNRLRVQTPTMRLPFDVLQKTDSATGLPMMSFALSMEKDHEEIQQLARLIQGVEERAKAVALGQGEKLFHTKPTKEVIEYQFRSAIKPSKEPNKYSPVLKLRFNTTKEGTPSVGVTDGTTKESMQLSSVVRNSKVVCLIEPSMVWFVGGQFGVSWTLIAVKVMQHGQGSVPEFRDINGVEFR